MIPFRSLHLLHVPIPAVGQSVLIRAEREQQSNVTSCRLQALELNPQADLSIAGSREASELPARTSPWPSSLLQNWITVPINSLGFPLRFCWWSSERGHSSLLWVLRQLPTHPRVELISLELLASHQEPDSKNILELLKKESVTNKMCFWIHSTIPICTHKA